MNWLKKLKRLFFCFACVTTFVVFVTAGYISVFWKQAVLGVGLLWQILFVSFLCSLGVLIYPEREVRTRTIVLIAALHYAQVNAIVLGCGLWFEWFYADNVPMVLGMLLLIAVVFALVSAVMWTRDKRIARQMNERLKQYQKQ